VATLMWLAFMLVAAALIMGSSSATLALASACTSFLVGEIEVSLGNFPCITTSIVSLLVSPVLLRVVVDAGFGASFGNLVVAVGPFVDLVRNLH
jgi:hypothetical protein